MDPELPPWEQGGEMAAVPRPLDHRAQSAPKLSLGIPPQNVGRLRVQDSERDVC